ncbi:MAG: FG-GAP-like repeat-containing protein [Balneolales bacterium]
MSPVPHALNVAIDDSITVTIEGKMISSGTLKNHIYIYGSQSGLHLQEGLDANRNVEDQTAWVKNFKFKPGELISVIIKEIVDGDFHLKPYQWQFSVAPESGTGEFKRREELYLPPSSEPVSIFAADLNGNDIPDLAVLDGSSGDVSIFANRESNMGLGFDKDPVNEIPTPADNSLALTAYQEDQRTASSTNYPHITGGDLYGNGYSSLMVTSKATDEIIIYRNNQDKENENNDDRINMDDDFYFEPQPIKTGLQPVMSAVADFNNDGKMDIAVLGSGNGQVIIHTNENDFDTTSYQVGNAPTSLVVRDFNNNGYLDIAVAVSGQDQIDFLENDQNGGFKDAVSTILDFSPGPLLAGNFSGSNSDGAPGDDFIELMVGAANSNRLELYTFDKNTGEFSSKQSLDSIEPGPAANFAAGGFFEKSALDIITAYQGYDHIDLYQNLGNKEFQSASSIDPEPLNGPPFGIGLAVADFALNGSMDIAVTNSSSNKITILYNDGGSRSPPSESGGVTAFPNPFTPNDDESNDRTGFNFSDADVHNPVLEIFNFEGRRIKTVRDLNGETLFWDGRNDSGKIQLPGVYIYVIKDGSKAIASGVVTLAR